MSLQVSLGRRLDRGLFHTIICGEFDHVDFRDATSVEYLRESVTRPLFVKKTAVTVGRSVVSFTDQSIDVFAKSS